MPVAERQQETGTVVVGPSADSRGVADNWPDRAIARPERVPTRVR